MSITVYGIKACNSMKKTFTKLDELGVDYDFHDYKKQSIDRQHVQRWVDALGIDKVLNKRGTTWRKLTDTQKNAANTDIDTAIELLLENTSMIKRPIIEGNIELQDAGSVSVLLCGYDPDELAATFRA